MKGSGLRRRIVTILIAVLLLVLFWKDVLSFSIQGIVRWQTGCQISSRKIDWQNNQLVMHDVLFVNHAHGHPFFHVRSDRVNVQFSWKQWLFFIKIECDHPHLSIFDELRFDNRSANGSMPSWIRTQMKIEDGTFAWHLTNQNPVFGKFSFADQKLNVEMGDGSMIAQWILADHDRKIDCSFHHLDISLLSKLSNFCSCSGFLSGSLLWEDGEIPSISSGRLEIEDFSFHASQWQCRGGAKLFKWEGEYHWNEREPKNVLDRILSFPHRMKIQWTDGWIERKDRKLDHLEGVFSSNQGVGLRWEIQGPCFSWEGKGFSKSLASNWLESCLCVNESKVHLLATLEERAHWAIDFEKMDADGFGLIESFWPQPWPCRLKNGTVTAQLQFEETQNGLENWKLQNLMAHQMEIVPAIAQNAKSDDWNIHCDEMKGNIEIAPDFLKSSIDLSVSQFGIQMEKIHGSSGLAQCLIQDGVILKWDVTGKLNGLDIQGNGTGNLQTMLATIQAKGNWSEYWFWKERKEPSSHLNPVVESVWTLKGNWNAWMTNVQASFSKDEAIDAQFEVVRNDREWSILNAQVHSPRMNLSNLSMILPLDCSGFADLSMNYFEDELQIDGTLFELDVKGDWGEFQAKQPSSELGFQFVWNRNTEKWKARTIATSCEGIFRKTKVPFTVELALKGDRGNQWSGEAKFSNVQWGALCQGKATVIASSQEGLLECLNGEANLAVGNASFPVHLRELKKQGDGWIFDCCVEHQFLDLGRFSGIISKNDQKFQIFLDPEKSHLLNSSIDLKNLTIHCNGSIEGLDLSYQLSLNQLFAASLALQEIDPVFHSYLNAPIDGAVQWDIHYSVDQSSQIRCSGIPIHWKGKEIPFFISIHQQSGGWKIERLQINALDLRCLAMRDESGWKIESGDFLWRDSFNGHLSGYLLKNGRCDLNLEQISIDLQKAIAPFIWEKLEGRLEGAGTFAFEWKKDMVPETVLDLNAVHMKSGDFFIDNQGLMKVYFSLKRGLLVQGLDLQVYKDDAAWPKMHARIGEMEFDFHRNHWVLHHAQMKLPATSLAVIQQKFSNHRLMSSFLNYLEESHDLEFIADIDSATDLSSLSCSMREAFIPFLGTVRHLQNVSLNWDSRKMNFSLSCLQEEHLIRLSSSTEFTPHPRGSVTLEDDEHCLTDLEHPLMIEWEMDPANGLSVHSIDGVFGGIEASFHAQNGTHLIGSARLNIGTLSEILPPRLKDAFHQIKMGKGYELKGRLYYNPNDLSDISFKGLLSGKQCELFGFQIRTLLAQVEIDASRLRFFEMKASDSAGICQIDNMLIHQGKDSCWNLSISSLKLIEFRPSLLQKAGHEVHHVGPLVVRELKLQNFKGTLGDRNTWTAKGGLSFINSFKREHTVFDLPSDFFGRIIGLDAELMIPVRGSLKFELKDGRIWLSHLQDAYSEGKRSKFFLVKEGLSPSIDLKGNLQIFVTMKQYVLFKITENFLITIDGSIDSPSFHLQKKSKILGI